MSSDTEASSEEVDDAAIPDIQLASQNFLAARPGEQYLHGISRTAKTSQARFSANVKSVFSQQEVFNLTAGVSALDPLATAYDNRFRVWRAELEQGFSLLFHGAGSKRSLLNRFAAQELARIGCVVVFNGFLSSASTSDLLDAIEEQIEDIEAVQQAMPATTTDKNESRILAIRQALESSSRPIFLLVHNIDGPALRAQKSQKALHLLATHPSIHLLASIDHLRSLLLFPRHSTASQPSVNSRRQHQPDGFIHHHVPTYKTAITESILSGGPSTLFAPTAYPPIASIRQSNTPASRIQATLSVLASMNDNAKFVFNVLATAQIAKMNGETVQQPSADASTPPSYAVPYSRIYTECRDSFIASSETQFDTLLAEFKDHSIILSSTSEQLRADSDAASGMTSMWLWINLETESLEKVQEKMG